MPGTPPLTVPDNLPRIGDTDSPDIPRDMNALADAVQVALGKKGVPVFANVAEADAWYLLHGTPTAGMVRYLQVPGIYQSFQNGIWVYCYSLAVRTDTSAPLVANVDLPLVWTIVEEQLPDTTPMVWSGGTITIPAKGVFAVDAGAYVTLDASAVCYIGIQLSNQVGALDGRYCQVGTGQIVTQTMIRAMDTGTLVTCSVQSTSGGTMSSAACRVTQIGHL